MQITDYTRMEQLFILAIQEVISQSGADLREPDYALLLSTTKGNVDLLSELPADSPVLAAASFVTPPATKVEGTSFGSLS